MAPSALLTCPKCNSSLDVGVFSSREPVPCSGCGSAIEATVFPAFFRPQPAAATGELVLEEGEASCFFHPQKRALLPCDGCGRFVCALCDVELKDQHLCPDCLEKGVRKKKLVDLDNRRFLYDTLALQLALWPVLFFFLTFLTAPAALFIAIRYRKEPLGLLRQSRWRFLVAGILAFAQIAIWAVLIANLVVGMSEW